MALEKKYAVDSKIGNSHYDALQDKHASFYFNGYGVKKHLKKLKKVIELEPHQKGYKEYTEMLAQKLAELDKTQDPFHYKIKPYQQTLKPSSLQKLKKIQNILDDQTNTKTIHQNQPLNCKKQGNSLQNLPAISRTTHVVRQSGYGVSKLDNSIDTAQQKQKKSISIADKINTKLTKISINQLNKIRSNKSLHTKKVNNNKRRFQSSQLAIKQVKHDDFVNFLKQRQENAEKASKVIKKQRIKQEIEEDLQQYV